MKLKTLKEIENLWLKDVKQLICSDSISNKLKQEAIKHIIALEKQGDYLLPMQDMKGDYVLNLKLKNAIINYIKWANNIKEKDLK